MKFKVKREYLVDETKIEIMTEEEIKEKIPALSNVPFYSVDKMKIYIDYPEIITIKRIRE